MLENAKVGKVAVLLNRWNSRIYLFGQRVVDCEGWARYPWGTPLEVKLTTFLKKEQVGQPASFSTFRSNSLQKLFIKELLLIDHLLLLKL